MSDAAARSDIELRMAEALVDCAHRLAMGSGDAAHDEADFDRRLKLTDAFLRGFQAVRLGIRLCLTLRAGTAVAVAKAQPAEADADAEDRERPDRSERERLGESDRERERDYEPVSLTKFLSTLRGVAKDAASLPTDADPAVLPRLEGLLAQFDGVPDAQPAPPGGLALRVRPPPSPQRSRLLGSAAPRVTLPGLGRPRPPPFASG